MIRVYVDGSGTVGGPGGCGYVAEIDGSTIEGSLPLRNATNQQAEILAAAFALHDLSSLGALELVVVSDSQYVVRGWTEWLTGWIARGWRTRSGPVANKAHWERLIAAAERHSSVRFEWTRGHVGTTGNERADELAGEARARALVDSTFAEKAAA